MMTEMEGHESEMESEDQGEVTEIPASLVDTYPEVGDVIQLTVVATNPDSGIITVGKSATPKPTEGGSDQMASEFDNAQSPT